MSQSDKTRQKLVDSMRKTKSGTTGKSGTTAAEPEKKAEAPKKPAATASAKPAPKRSEKKATADNQVDSYQSPRRRVWPD